MTVTQAVCLVGGRGTRLGALTDSMPKPLLLVGGRPFLDYLVQEARRFGLERLLLLSGYQSDTIGKRYAGQKFGSLSVDVVVESSPAGTAGALANAARHLDETFFLLNGDSFFDFNWLRLATALPQDDWAIHATLAKGITGTRYGRIDLEGDRIRGFRPEGGSSEPINAGIYLVRRKILDAIKTSPCSLEREILPKLAERGELIGTAAEGAFIDIGIPDDFARAQQVMPTYMRRPVAFLDRDGVLNRDDGYVHRPDQIAWIDGAIDAVRWLNDAGYYVFVITNQAGVAHGHYSEEAVHELHFWMQREMQRHGAHIDAFEYCPHHPDGKIEQYRQASMLRKPAPGMITKLQAEWATDPSGSFLIGDRDTDVQAAEAAGIPGHKFPGGNLLQFVRRHAPVAQRTRDSG
jgi:D,D-heptose 1,7-bisphosphate phosphatase